jgi:CDP-glucose 4,6-dehydratase
MGTVNVLESVRKVSSVRSFVNVTTDKVYENKEWVWGYRENENLNGRDPYSNSKSCSELVTQSYRASFDFATAISTARSGNVIGGGDYSADRIIPDCIRAAEAGTEIVLRNPSSVRPYQHVLECLSGYLLLAEKQHSDAALAGAYNFGPDEDGCVTTSELAALFCTAWNAGASGAGACWRTEHDGGPHEAGLLKLDCAKAKASLGWRPKWEISTAVEKTVEFAQCRSEVERKTCIKKQIREYF